MIYLAKHIIDHDRPNCIGCGACAAVCPSRWTMNADGKSDIIDSKTLENGWEQREIDEDEFEGNKQAAESCPVNVIHLTEKETGKKLI